MTNTKHEDAIMKMGFNYFRDTILKALGINFQYEEIGPTELIELTIHSLYMDFTFLTTNITPIICSSKRKRIVIGPTISTPNPVAKLL